MFPAFPQDNKRRTITSSPSPNPSHTDSLIGSPSPSPKHNPCLVPSTSYPGDAPGITTTASPSNDHGSGVLLSLHVDSRGSATAFNSSREVPRSASTPSAMPPPQVGNGTHYTDNEPSTDGQDEEAFQCHVGMLSALEEHGAESGGFSNPPRPKKKVKAPTRDSTRPSPTQPSKPVVSAGGQRNTKASASTTSAQDASWGGIGTLVVGVLVVGGIIWVSYTYHQAKAFFTSKQPEQGDATEEESQDALAEEKAEDPTPAVA